MLELKEEKEKIEVDHPGILEVPAGKKVYDLPFSHFEDLVDKKGYAPIIRALNNLKVWNKNDDKALSDWAEETMEKLKQKFRKDVWADNEHLKSNRLHSRASSRHLRENRKLRESCKVYIADLDEFEPWAGAVETWEKILEKNRLDELDMLIEDTYPEGISTTQLNDMLRFDYEWVYDMLGIGDEDEDDDDVDDDEDEDDDDIEDESYKSYRSSRNESRINRQRP